MPSQRRRRHDDLAQHTARLDDMHCGLHPAVMRQPPAQPAVVRCRNLPKSDIRHRAGPAGPAGRVIGVGNRRATSSHPARPAGGRRSRGCPSIPPESESNSGISYGNFYIFVARTQTYMCVTSNLSKSAVFSRKCMRKLLVSTGMAQALLNRAKNSLLFKKKFAEPKKRTSLDHNYSH